MEQQRKGCFSDPKFDAISGKEETTWVIPQAEQQALVDVLMQRFRWNQDWAVQQLDQVQKQVAHLYSQGRGKVSPEEIWAHLREYLLGSHSMGGYEAHKPLAPYIARSARREMSQLVGGGPKVKDSGGGESDAIRRQLAAATVSINIDGTMTDPDGNQISAMARAMGIQLPTADDPLAYWIQAEELGAMIDDDKSRMEVRKRCLPLVYMRCMGLSVHRWPEMREQMRREENPHRRLVKLDPERQERWQRIVKSRSEEGKRLREITTRCGVRRWAKVTGIEVSAWVESKYVELVREWQGPDRNPLKDTKLRRIARQFEARGESLFPRSAKK